MTFALTGATGFVGQALVDHALDAGQWLRALVRREQTERKGVRWIAGDLASPPALRRMVSGSEAVIHVAGVVNAADAAGFETGNVTGTANLIEAAKSEGVRRLVFVSSLAAREPELSAYGASKAKAEELVKASGLEWTIVRPPAVYGPRDTEMFELFRVARWGLMPMPPREGRTSLIHVHDLVRLLLALAPGGEAVTHMTYEPDDGRDGGWSHNELARAIGWAMGRRAWVVHLSRASLERAARIDRMVRGPKAKLTPDRVGYMTHPDWVVSAGALPPADLWHPEVPTLEGLKATAEWYRANGWI